MQIQGCFWFDYASLQVLVYPVLNPGSPKIQEVRCFHMDVCESILFFLFGQMLQRPWRLFLAVGRCFVLLQFVYILHRLLEQVFVGVVL